MYADLWAPNGVGVASSNDMEIDNDVVPESEANEKVNMANAVDLSESEDEEEMEVNVRAACTVLSTRLILFRTKCTSE